MIQETAQAMFSVDQFSDEIDSITEFTGLEQGFTGNIMWVFHLIFMIKIFSMVAKQLMRPENGFQGSEFIKPFVFWLLIVGWFQLSPYVGTLAEATASYVEESQEQLDSQSTVFSGQLKQTLLRIEEGIAVRKDLEQTGTYSPIAGMTTELEFLDDQLYIGIAKWIYEVIITIDGILYLLFYFVSRIWLVLVGFGGPIALVVAMLSDNYSPLLSWAKAYISVALWSSVCLLVISICNEFLLMANNAVLDTFASSMIDLEKANKLGDITLGIGNIVSVVGSLVGIGLVFILLKIFLMSKVPSIIQTWVGGAASASGGFAMALVGINSAKNIGTAGVKAGMGVASGGSSVAAGAAASKLKG